MFWFSLLIVFSLLAIYYNIRFYCIEDDDKTKDDKVDYYGWLSSITIVITSVLSIICLTSTSILYSDYQRISKSNALLPSLIAQKEHIIEVVSDQLSADQLDALANATQPDSIIVILGNPATPAAQILSERASQIIALNIEITRLQTELNSLRIDYCNDLNHWMHPRFPLFLPDCDYDFGNN